jgi:hypothetical protein
MDEQKTACCDMKKKVGLGIAKIYTETECGVPDSVMVDFHNFGYESPSNLPVAAALKLKFCPWCGTERSSERGRIIEVIRDA